MDKEPQWRRIAAINADYAEIQLMRALRPAIIDIVSKYEAEIERIRTAVNTAKTLEQAQSRVNA